MDTSPKEKAPKEENQEKPMASGIALALLPLLSFVYLLAVFAGSSGAVVLYQQYQIQFMIVIGAYFCLCVLLLIMNEDTVQSYYGALIATGTLLPAALILTTMIIYGIGWADAQTCDNFGGKYVLFWGAAITVWFWIVATYICCRFAAFENAIPSSYGEFRRRFLQVKSELFIHCPNGLGAPNKPAQYDNPTLATACREIWSLTEEIENSTKRPGATWILGTGYISVWGQMYRAEEALIEVQPQEKAVAGAIYDERRLEGSDIDLNQRNELLAKVRLAVDVLDSGARQFLKNPTTVPPPPFISTPSQLSVHPVGTDYCKLLRATGGTPPYHWEVTNEAKTAELKDGGLQLDKHTGVLSGKAPDTPKDFSFEVRVTDSTGLSITKVFSLAIKDTVAGVETTSCNPVLNTEARAVLREVRRSINEYRESRWNGLILARNRLMATLFFTSLTVYLLLVLALINNTQKGSVYAAAIFYLVGAMFGLIGRLQSESENKTGVYDYGLAMAGLITVPVFSGLTAIGGVVLIAMLPFAGQILGPPLHSEPLTISTAQQLQEATVAKSYFQELTATGGTQPYKWAIKTNGMDELPDGLDLNLEGALIGTPANSGSGGFSLQVTDSAGTVVEKVFTLRVNPLPDNIANLDIDTTSPLPAAIVRTTYSKRLRAVGGKPPYAWSFADTATMEKLRNAGFELDEKTGELKGSPNQAALLTFGVKLTNADDPNNTPVVKTFSLTVKQPEPETSANVVVKPPPAGTIPALKDIFDLSKNLGGILIAAIFGLTPGLFFDRLKQLTNKYKEDLKNSQSTQG